MRAPLVSIVLLAGTGVAAARPLAAAAEDLDGDGKPEAIEIRADGAIAVDGTKRAELRLGQALARARLSVSRVGSTVRIVVEAAAGREEIAVVFDARWRELVRFPLGGVGLDREYGIAVDATPTGVYRFQTRPEVRRCDARPSYLFVERLEGAVFKRLAVPPSLVSASAPQLTARLEPAAQAPGTEPVVFRARAASHQAGAADAGALAIPQELDDGRTHTVWREDIAASAGEGHFFTFQPRVASARAQQLRIVPGNPTSSATMRSFNRPRALAIVAADRAWRVELPDAAGEPLGAAYVVDLPQPPDGCVTVVLESTYGRPQGTTAIAELEVFAEGERSGGGDALLAKVVAEDADGAQTAAAALARRGAAAAAALDAELGKTTDAAVRRRLIGALAKIHDPAASASLVRAAAEGWVRDKDLDDVITALARNGQVAPLRELAARPGLALESRITAASQLMPTGAGLEALVELAGDGPRKLRAAVIDRLALAPAAVLADTAAALPRPRRAGDVWRALTKRVRHDAASRPAAVAAMTAALAAAADYERRYRLIDGVATHGDDDALRALDDLLRGLPPGARTAALRQVAIRGLASAPRPAGVELVVAFARDGDPGVRLAALSALATGEADKPGPWHGRGGPDAIDRVIMNGLATDTWPEIRRRAANALAVRCQRPGPARALADAVAKDAVVDVRGDALAALVQCDAAGIRELLPRTWNDPKAPLELRTRAVDLTVSLGDRRLATELVARFAQWRGQAIESAAAMTLAQSAAAAIGRLGAPGAAAALMAALDDSAFPEIVSAAALGLGALGRACPPAAKAKLNLIARSSDQASIAAKRAAAQCGR